MIGTLNLSALSSSMLNAMRARTWWRSRDDLLLVGIGKQQLELRELTAAAVELLLSALVPQPTIDAHTRAQVVIDLVCAALRSLETTRTDLLPQPQKEERWVDTGVVQTITYCSIISKQGTPSVIVFAGEVPSLVDLTSQDHVLFVARSDELRAEEFAPLWELRGRILTEAEAREQLKALTFEEWDEQEIMS